MRPLRWSSGDCCRPAVDTGEDEGEGEGDDDEEEKSAAKFDQLRFFFVRPFRFAGTGPVSGPSAQPF